MILRITSIYIYISPYLTINSRQPLRMKTLSSRAEECNGATLARVADAAVRLRTRSPELEELLQRLAEVHWVYDWAR